MSKVGSFKNLIDYPVKFLKLFRIQEVTHNKILSEYDEVRKMLISIINNPEKWCL